MKKFSKTTSIKFVLIICFIFTIMLSSILFSCNQQSNFDNEITDSYGRCVKYPQKVEKIATVGSATRTVVYAGAQNKLVGITLADKPSELKPYTLAYEDIFNNLEITNDGNHMNGTTVDKEKMLSLKPDVIFSSRSADECEKLQNDIKIPVIGVFFQDEIFSENVYKAIEIVGIVADTKDKANSTIDYLKNTKIELDSKCNGSTDKVYRGAINYKGSKNITGTYSNYCIYDYIKANNVADIENLTGAYDTNLEQILTWNPDYIFMDYQNKDKVIAQLDDNPKFTDNLNAFNKSNVYFVTPFNNNGTNIEYAVFETFLTAQILYPDKFNNINLEQKLGEILEKMLGSNIYDKLISKGVYFGKAKF